jgi:hypothetical protein
MVFLRMERTKLKLKYAKITNVEGVYKLFVILMLQLQPKKNYFKTQLFGFRSPVSLHEIHPRNL